jgi:hypothetical protein
LTDDKSPEVFETAPGSTPRSFANAELISCETCLRANPPTRASCLYCGAQLPVTEHTAELATPVVPMLEPNPTEASLPGFLVVIAPDQSKASSDLSLEEITRVLQLAPDDFESAIQLNCSVPVLRTATHAEGANLADRLRGLGIDAGVFPEEGLELEVANKKTRSLGLTDDGVTGSLTSGEHSTIRWDELSLIVSGRLMVTRKEIEERKGIGRAKPVDNRELFSDEPVVDLYRNSEAVGWRIAANSFDFSCLGEAKAMTAFENLTTLINLLKARAPGIDFDSSYLSLRSVLNNVWPLEPQTKPGDWRRRGVGKVDISTVTIIDNENQFNAYSRLRQRISLSEREGGR